MGIYASRTNRTNTGMWFVGLFFEWYFISDNFPIKFPLKLLSMSPIGRRKQNIFFTCILTHWPHGNRDRENRHWKRDNVFSKKKNYNNKNHWHIHIYYAIQATYLFRCHRRCRPHSPDLYAKYSRTKKKKWMEER